MYLLARLYSDAELLSCNIQSCEVSRKLSVLIKMFTFQCTLLLVCWKEISHVDQVFQALLSYMYCSY